MQDEQPSFIRNDQELLEVALSIDPKILNHFRLLEQPYRGGPDFRYLYTTDQVQEVLIRAKLLKKWTEEALHVMQQPEQGERFFFRSITDSASISPEEMYLTPVWKQALSTDKTPLLVLE